MRKDGAANREKLLMAASEVMREHGGDVALEVIAARAGTTRGTVYRNFSDRSSLYASVLDMELVRIQRELDHIYQCDIFEIMRRFSGLMMVYDKFLRSLPDLSDYIDDGKSQGKMAALLAIPLQRAQDAKLLRADLTSKDVLLACRMIAADWRLDMEPDQQTALNRRLDLILRGLKE